MSSSRTFLHICLSEAWGGLEMAVSKWNEVLAENGHMNLNICTPQSPLAKDLKENGYSVLEWNSAQYFAPDFTIKLNRLLAKYQIDVILLQNLRDLWLVSPAMLGFPDIQLIGFAQMLLGVKKKDFLHRWIYKRLNKLCVLTHWQKKALLPYLPVHEDLYCTVPNFVDCNKFNPNRRSEAFRYQLGIREDQFAIGAVGRLDRQKGQLELVKAFHKVSQKYVNCKLVLVGEATQGEEAQMAYAKDIHKLVEDLNLQTRVIFTGFRKDVYKIYANLDLFVLPSYRETFGFVVVEAMASGVPVLGTNAGGVTEILGSGNYGYLCEPQDVDSMADKLEHILSNQKDREFTAQAALTHVRNTYEKSKVYQSLMKHIQ